MTDPIPPHIDALLGREVRVTSPHGEWTGILVGYAGDPSVIVDTASAGRVCLPAAYEVTAAPGVTGDWPPEAVTAAVAVIDARISASSRVSAPVSASLAGSILNAVAPLIRADERERIRQLALVQGAVYCVRRPCTCIRLGSDPAIRSFAGLIREPS